MRRQLFSVPVSTAIGPSRQSATVPLTPDFDRLDAIGVPKPRVFFRLDDYTAAALAAARKIHEELFLALGATEIGHLP